MNPFHTPLSIPTGPAEAAPSEATTVSRSGFGSSGYGSTVTFRDGVATVTSNAPTSMNTADIGNGHTGILGSATSATGSPIGASAITPTSLVMCDGMQTTAANAERLGYLTKNAATGLYEPGPAARMSEKADAEKARIMAGEPAENAPELASQGAPEAFETEAEASFQHINTATMPLSQATLLRELTTDGYVTAETIAKLASEAKMEPADMNTQLGGVLMAFARQGDAAILKAGADPAALMQWARSDPSAWKQVGTALREHYLSRSTTAYAAVTRAYLASLPDRDPAAAMAVKFTDGATVRRNNGRVVVHVPSLGTEIGFAQAVKQGLAKVAPR